MLDNNTKWVVKDSHGEPMRVFFSYQIASDYKFACGNSGWTIEKFK